jgi:hypothetical protein
MTKPAPPAFDYNALYAKSQLYVRRAFRARSANDFDEYRLWASLAVELLGKAALARVSPSLIADPTHQESLFAACGVPLGTDYKTITAKTLFSRLSHISKDFDPQVQKFCEQLALQRNAELHSGEAPFVGAAQEVWEREYWYAVSMLLKAQERDLDSWLGAEEAAAPKEAVAAAEHAVMQAVAQRVERFRTQFLEAHKNPTKRAQLIADSEKILPWERHKEFSIYADDYVSQKCPACGATGVLGGTLWSEELSEEQDDEDPTVEYVDKTYLSEEFRCFTCGFVADGRREVLGAGITDEFYETDTRERQFEPEYDNE